MPPAMAWDGHGRKAWGGHPAAGRLELQVLEGEALVDELLEGIDADADVVGDVGLIDGLVAFGGFHAVGRHGLVAYQKKGSGGNFVVEAGHEDGGGLHVDCEGAEFAKVFFELNVVFPDAAVGGINGASPVVAGGLADGGRDGFLKGKGRQGGNLGREVVVARALAADGGDGEDEVAEFGAVFKAAALAEEEHSLGFDGGEQVHDGGGGGAAPCRS